MDQQKIIDWLLEGDVAIRYQIHRDLLACDRPDLRQRIAGEGWGAQFLSRRLPNGHWGRSFYQPKWISSHYTLLHRLFLSDRTGEIINKEFLKLTYPGRWKYNILRALDYFQHAGISWDDRMQPAMDVLLKKRNKNGTWNVQARHPGQVHFEMEKAGKPSRWNTLRALRVLRHFNTVLFA